MVLTEVLYPKGAHFFRSTFSREEIGRGLFSISLCSSEQAKETTISSGLVIRPTSVSSFLTVPENESFIGFFK